MNRSHGSILLVEDDADDQFFISRAFKQAGVEAPMEIASDGQSAIDLLSRPLGDERGVAQHTRLVLLDLNLPRKPGLEVLKWIRGMAEWKTIVVIVLTSSPSEDDMRQAYAYGANAYVLKPADPTRLGEFARLVRDFWFNWNQVPAPPKVAPRLS